MVGSSFTSVAFSSEIFVLEKQPPYRTVLLPSDISTYNATNSAEFYHQLGTIEIPISFLYIFYKISLIVVIVAAVVVVIFIVTFHLCLCVRACVCVCVCVCACVRACVRACVHM